MNGTLIFGMKSFNFVHESLGSQFCLGLDKLLVYNIVSELRMFTRSYGLYNGGGGVSDDFRVKGKQHNKALELIQKALRINADYKIARYNQAIVYMDSILSDKKDKQLPPATIRVERSIQ